MAKDNIVLLGCGDVGPMQEPIDAYSVLARPVLATGDIRLAQCERVYSERGSQQTQGGHHSRLKPHMASVFSDCGFNVVSLASNHAMDWGGEALMDTLELLQKKGIQTIGAGRNLQEARQPAIVDQNGVRVAILGYCSVLQKGYDAGPNRVGIAPLRVHTYYEPIEYQPGTPPRVITTLYEQDLEGMVQDIAAAKKSAHAVVISLHWGIHFVPRMIADYQTLAAKAAFEAGADLVIGHHQHIPKAIAVHAGKVCFHGIGKFIMSATANRGILDNLGKHYGLAIDPDNPHLSYKDTHRSMIAKGVFSRQGVEKVSFLPVMVDKQSRPEVLRHGDPRFDDMVRYVDWASEDYNHKFVVEGDEVVVSGA